MSLSSNHNCVTEYDINLKCLALPVCQTLTLKFCNNYCFTFDFSVVTRWYWLYMRIQIQWVQIQIKDLNSSINSSFNWAKWTSVGFSMFYSFSFLLTFVFLFKKTWALPLQNVIISFKITLIEKPHTFLLLDLWFLKCKKKVENAMISAWVRTRQILT